MKKNKMTVFQDPICDNRKDTRKGQKKETKKEKEKKKEKKLVDWLSVNVEIV